MTVRFLKVMWLLGSLLTFTIAVNAQSEVVTVHVPFAFEAGGKLLSAGDYRIDKEEESGVLLMHGGPGNSAAFLTVAMEEYRSAEAASVIFERQGTMLVLSAIRMPGQQARVVLASHALVK
jgi:hypothetical protein